MSFVLRIRGAIPSFSVFCQVGYSDYVLLDDAGTPICDDNGNFIVSDDVTRPPLLDDSGGFIEDDAGNLILQD